MKHLYSYSSYPRIVSRWNDFNFFNKKETYLSDSIHNYILWCLSGKLNWIEFYIWIENHKNDRSIIGLFEDKGFETEPFFHRYENFCEWQPLFLPNKEKLILRDIGFYLHFISIIPKYSGLETYNNHNSYIDLLRHAQTCSQR